MYINFLSYLLVFKCKILGVLPVTHSLGSTSNIIHVRNAGLNWLQKDLDLVYMEGWSCLSYQYIDPFKIKFFSSYQYSYIISFIIHQNAGVINKNTKLVTRLS